MGPTRGPLLQLAQEESLPTLKRGSQRKRKAEPFSSSVGFDWFSVHPLSKPHREVDQQYRDRERTIERECSRDSGSSHQTEAKTLGKTGREPMDCDLKWRGCNWTCSTSRAVIPIKTPIGHCR